MANTKKRMSLLTSAATKRNAHPHPGPLPRGEGETSSAQKLFERINAAHHLSDENQKTDNGRKTKGISGSASELLPLPGERVRVRADNPPDLISPTSDWLLWQLADSAFPTGGFAHSLGLEAAWQHGEVRNRTELLSFIEAGLQQLGHAALPFVMAAFDSPEKLGEFDQLCDAFTSNHVANRASRAQGRAFLSAVERIFPERRPPARQNAASLNERAGSETGAPNHFAPVFGACLRQLSITRETTGRLFFFNQLRSVLAAAVRLNIIGPMEAQMLQQKASTKAEEILVRCQPLTLDDLAQTSPLLDLWQGAQDRLYSRLFQS
jgi:urease accessory protein